MRQALLNYPTIIYREITPSIFCSYFLVFGDHCIWILHFHIYRNTGIIAFFGLFGIDHGTHIVKNLFNGFYLFGFIGRNNKFVQVNGRPGICISNWDFNFL